MGKKGKGKGGGGGGGSQNSGQGEGSNPDQGRGPNQGQGGGQNRGQIPGPNQGQGGDQNRGQVQTPNQGQARGPNHGQGRGQNPGQTQGQNAGRGRGRGRGGEVVTAPGYHAPGQQQAPALGQAPRPAATPGFHQGPKPATPPGFNQGPRQAAPPGLHQGSRPATPPGFNQGPRQAAPPAFHQGPRQAAPPAAWQPTPQPAVQGPPPGQNSPQPLPQPAQPPRAQPAPSPSGDVPASPRRGPQSAKSCQVVALPQRANCPQEPKAGRGIVLEVNHLLLKINDPAVKIYHYDVAIDPDKPKRFMRLVMAEVQKKCYPRNHPGFDGSKNLYSKGPLPIQDEMTVEVNIADEERQDKKPKTFKVTIKLARNNISLQELFAYQRSGRSTSIPQDVIQAVDVILRSASAEKFVQVGRSFFCPPMQPMDLGNGMELWYGFYQSFVMGSKPYLNIDVAHKGFPKSQPLLQLLKAMDSRAESPMDAIKYKKNDFERFIKGLKVEYQLPNIETSKRTYRVNGLTKSAVEERFKLGDDGPTMTIGEYFAKEKNYQLRWPHLPCVHVGPREKDIRVPMELCVLTPGQATQKKLDELQTANMVKIAATNVEDRKRKIREAMQRANLNSNPHVKELGLSVATEFARINGRVLPAPKLAYYQNRTIQPNKGVWRMDGMQFRETRDLQKWVCLVACNVRQDNISDFTKNLMSEARKVNLNMAPPAPTIFMDCRDQRKIKDDLTYRLQDLSKKGCQLVLVVISGFNKLIYGQVKQVAELQVGVLTQCVKDSTVLRRNNGATAHNIILKINAKFNGVNQVIDKTSDVKCFNNKVLVFGADVTHPSPDSKDIPSVAAVTASHDIKGFKYNMRIRLQAPRQEMIEDLGAIVYEQIAIYSKETGGLPQHIVFYRDGVSEGQFQQVLSQELSAIFKACEKHRVKPKVTFLVVQKRHHTRFFPTNPRDSDDRNGNVPAGTIVDMEITHPNEIDFYLVSHASIQGVARPTKYHVLWDDANMSENDIQLMTYNLCHLFTRCDRAVSYPAPTYYAHLAASRGRVYLEGKTVRIDDQRDWVNESKIIQTALNFTNIAPMYFV